MDEQIIQTWWQVEDREKMGEVGRQVESQKDHPKLWQMPSALVSGRSGVENPSKRGSKER